MRAVEVFGFHLATVDLRQSSDKHEETIADLLAKARIEPDYAAVPSRTSCLATAIATRTAADRLGWSARATHRALKVARNIADLEGLDSVQAHHVAEAVRYRRGLTTRA